MLEQHQASIRACQRPLRITDKQYKILTVIIHGNRDIDGTWTPVDMDELLERLAYRTTKASMQYSIRALIASGLIKKEYETRRGTKRVTYLPLPLAKQMMGCPDPHFVESEDLEFLHI